MILGERGENDTISWESIAHCESVNIYSKIIMSLISMQNVGVKNFLWRWLFCFWHGHRLTLNQSRAEKSEEICPFYTWLHFCPHLGECLTLKWITCNANEVKWWELFIWSWTFCCQCRLNSLFLKPSEGPFTHFNGELVLNNSID